MKKLFCLLMTLLCSLGLASCTGESVALPKMTDLLLLRRHPITAFSTAESARMQTHMSANRVLATEEALYTLELDRDQEPVLASYKLENGQLSQYRRLSRDCVAKWLVEHEGSLYYVNELNAQRIERIELATGKKTVLTDYPCSYLQIKEGQLWFCDGAGYFCKAELDGSGKTAVIGKSCCYTYVMDDSVLFQSESEGEILKLFIIEEGKEIALTERTAYAPVIIGERLYYSMDGQIHSMGIDGMGTAVLESPKVSGAAEYILEDGAWYARAITEGYGLNQWCCPIEGGQSEDKGYKGYLYCDYADGFYRVDADYFSDARLRSFILTGSDGSRSEYLYGQATNIR